MSISSTTPYALRLVSTILGSIKEIHTNLLATRLLALITTHLQTSLSLYTLQYLTNRVRMNIPSSGRAVLDPEGVDGNIHTNWLGI